MPNIASSLLFPLLKMLGVMALSLGAAQALEAFGWTRWTARLASPLGRFARLGADSRAAFSLSFVSSSSANALLGEALAAGRMSRKELVLTNIINSAPAFFIHLPTVAATAYAFLGADAGIYVALIFSAAFLRTAGAAAVARFALEAPPGDGFPATPPRTARGALRALLEKFVKRMRKICLFTAPVYCAVYALQQGGAFKAAEAFIGAHIGALPFLFPGAVSIVLLFLAAESAPAFAAAAALIQGGTITPDQAVLALLAGNILSSPVRALRHQLPAYAGYFSPGIAVLLVAANQTLRAVSLVLIAFCFFAVVAG